MAWKQLREIRQDAEQNPVKDFTFQVKILSDSDLQFYVW